LGLVAVLGGQAHADVLPGGVAGLIGHIEKETRAARCFAEDCNHTTELSG
jgi:hypothetical protein